ncbi:MAG: AbrB/MazE/SpoVT family DNA-binding domain-containing protein [Clostridia bacterium]|nr:AbrB/MazE/SpoVT family DNA-binding domain-containing protein [Clostridia bacterium]
MKYSMEKTIDSLGRIVIPKGMRDYYGISVNEKVKLIPSNEGILIMKSEPCESSDKCKDDRKM